MGELMVEQFLKLMTKMSLQVQKNPMKSKKVKTKKKLKPQDREVKLQNTTGKEKTIKAFRYKRKITCKGTHNQIKSWFLKGINKS